MGSKHRVFSFIWLVLLCFVTACSTSDTSPKEEPRATETVQDVPESIEEGTEEPIVPETRQARIVSKATVYAIGDILLHDAVYRAAETPNGYDFTSAFTSVKRQLSEADLTIANQESMIGGSELGLSSYPAFNSPFEIGDALQDAGVDLVTTANNHTLDRGVKAIERSIAHWNQIGMPYTGSFQSDEDRATLRVLEANDISFAFLAYTYGTNGVVPKQPYHVNYIDLAQMGPDIEEAEANADVTVVSLHFGTEYEPLPNEEQQSLVQSLADLGVDVIIGHHPHVLQPPDVIEGANGQETFVIYSLGNFLSGQKGDDRNTGGIVGIDVVKTVEGNRVTLDLVNPIFYPIFTRKSASGPYEVVSLKQARPDLFDVTATHMSRWLSELDVRP